MGIPAVPLADLYEGCRAGIEKRGGEVRFRATLRGFRMEGTRVRSLVFDDGAEIPGDTIVFAVPQSALLDLIRRRSRNPIRHLRDYAICTIHRLPGYICGSIGRL